MSFCSRNGFYCLIIGNFFECLCVLIEFVEGKVKVKAKVKVC